MRMDVFSGGENLTPRGDPFGRIVVCMPLASLVGSVTSWLMGWAAFPLDYAFFTPVITGFASIPTT